MLYAVVAFIYYVIFYNIITDYLTLKLKAKKINSRFTSAPAHQNNKFEKEKASVLMITYISTNVTTYINTYLNCACTILTTAKFTSLTDNLPIPL